MPLLKNFKTLMTYGPGRLPIIEELPIPKPGLNQILVKVSFAPVNPSDIYTSQGAYPVGIDLPHGVGLEGSGTVVAVGEDLKVPHQVGDRVHIVSVGTYGEYVLAQADECRKIKGDLSFEEAASHHINPSTVACMGDIVKKAGAKAVIHTAGSSALGRMLIRYFKRNGVKTINVVRNDDFIEELKADGADYVLNSQRSDFEEQLKEIAYHEKATTAFDAVAGEMTTLLMRSLPVNSTCYIYGGLGGFDVDKLNVAQFIFQGKTLSGLWVTMYLKQAEERGEAEKMMDEVYDLLPTVLSSKVQKVFKLEEIGEAFAYYQQHSSKGKILIQPN